MTGCLSPALSDELCTYGRQVRGLEFAKVSEPLETHMYSEELYKETFACNGIIPEQHPYAQDTLVLSITTANVAELQKKLFLDHLLYKKAIVYQQEEDGSRWRVDPDCISKTLYHGWSTGKNWCIPLGALWGICVCHVIRTFVSDIARWNQFQP